MFLYSRTVISIQCVVVVVFFFHFSFLKTQEHKSKVHFLHNLIWWTYDQSMWYTLKVHKLVF